MPLWVSGRRHTNNSGATMHFVLRWHRRLMGILSRVGAPAPLRGVLRQPNGTSPRRWACGSRMCARIWALTPLAWFVPGACRPWRLRSTAAKDSRRWSPAFRHAAPRSRTSPCTRAPDTSRSDGDTTYKCKVDKLGLSTEGIMLGPAMLYSVQVHATPTQITQPPSFERLHSRNRNHICAPHKASNRCSKEGT